MEEEFLGELGDWYWQHSGCPHHQQCEGPPASGGDRRPADDIRGVRGRRRGGRGLTPIGREKGKERPERPLKPSGYIPARFDTSPCPFVLTPPPPPPPSSSPPRAKNSSSRPASERIEAKFSFVGPPGSFTEC